MALPFPKHAAITVAAGVLSLASVAVAGVAAAQTAPPAADGGESSRPQPSAHGRNPEFDVAMQACAAEQGLAPPPVPGHEPAQDKRAEAPAEGKGKRPDMKKLETCMTAKGFAKPKGGPGGDRPPPPGR